MTERQQNKTYKFGILSTAAIAIKVADAIIDSQKGELYAVASRSLEKAQEWANKHKKQIKTYGTYEELLNDKQIDAVYIPLPTSLKFDWAMKAAQAGKHILVEKPLVGTSDTKQLQELLQFCAKNNIQFMDCTMFVHSPRTMKIEEIIKKQEIGPVRKNIASLTFRGSEDFIKTNIRQDNSLEPLGALGDVAWYPSMASLVAFGFEVPVKVQTVQWRIENGAIVEVSAVIHFSDNRISFIDGSFTESFRNNWEITGTHGTIRIKKFCDGGIEDGQDHSWHKYKGGKYLEITKDSKLGTIELEAVDQTACMVDDFISTIETNDQSQRWGQRTLLNQRIMAHIYNSIQQNGAILNFDNTI